MGGRRRNFVRSFAARYIFCSPAAIGLYMKIYTLGFMMLLFLASLIPAAKAQVVVAIGHGHHRHYRHHHHHHYYRH
jgi:hypothetical protein